MTIQDKEELLDKRLDALTAQYPFLSAFLENNKIRTEDVRGISFREYLTRMTPMQKKASALDQGQMESNFISYFAQHADAREDAPRRARELTILPGVDKDGNPEPFPALTICSGELISVVGRTGSGKSRLLADIEWMADADTPTRRRILIDGRSPDARGRFAGGRKYVAQLSQNMNFVLDLSVGDFLAEHARIRAKEDETEIIKRVVERANELSGERFGPDTPIVQLSGGQSRALMIADTAILSDSPIVLIDEIENAGIDRKRAISLMTDAKKITLISTHDPALALSAKKRIVMKKGAISGVIQTSAREKEILRELEAMDENIRALRGKLRDGDILE